MNSFVARYSLALWPAAIFLFILPFTGTVALRLTSLAIATAITFITWRTQPIPPISFKLPLLLWAGMALLSLSKALDPAYTLGEIKNEIGYTMLAFFTFYSLTQGEREWKLWNRVLILGFLVISASGISAYWLAHGKWVTNGPHGGVGDYSTYLILVLPFILLGTIKTPLTKFPANLTWLLLPILLVGGYLTLNRAFWPALLVVAATFIFLYHFRTHPLQISKRTLVIFILLGTLAAVPFIAVVKHKVIITESNRVIPETTIQGDPRIPLWKFAFENIRDHPLTGAGFGRGALRQTLKSHFNNGQQLWHAHNLFLNYAVQMGVGGLLAIMLLFLAIGKEFWKLYRSTKPDISLIGIVGLALLSGVIAKNMTDDFFVRQHALLFWALVGMCLGYGKRHAHESSAHNANQNQSNTVSPP